MLHPNDRELVEIYISQAKANIQTGYKRKAMYKKTGAFFQKLFLDDSISFAEEYLAMAEDYLRLIEGDHSPLEKIRVKEKAHDKSRNFQTAG